MKLLVITISFLLFSTMIFGQTNFSNRTWKSGCLVGDDLNGEIVVMKFRDSRVTQEIIGFKDKTCSQKILTMRGVYSYQLKNEFEGKFQRIDWITQNAWLEFHDKEAADNASANNLFEKNNWAVNINVEITGLPTAPYLGMSIDGFLYQEGDRLWYESEAVPGDGTTRPENAFHIQSPRPVRIVITPTQAKIEVGKGMAIRYKAYDKNGSEIFLPFLKWEDQSCGVVNYRGFFLARLVNTACSIYAMDPVSGVKSNTVTINVVPQNQKYYFEISKWGMGYNGGTSFTAKISVKAFGANIYSAKLFAVDKDNRELEVGKAPARNGAWIHFREEWDNFDTKMLILRVYDSNGKVLLSRAQGHN